MNTREAAQGQWDKIFSHYGLPPVTGKKHFKGKCPLCGRRGKFRIDDKDGRGTYICVCSAGTGFQLLERSRKKSFRELSDEVDQLLGRVYSRGTYQTEAITATGTRDRVLNQFNNLSDIPGTSAQAYLRSRGISRLPEQYVRFCDKPPPVMIWISGIVSHCGRWQQTEKTGCAICTGLSSPVVQS